MSIQPTPVSESGSTRSSSTGAIARRLKLAAEQRAEEFLAEVPATLRRIRLLLLVVAVSVPAFLIALIVVLWRLAS